jgi:hypothetical protein
MTDVGLLSRSARGHARTSPELSPSAATPGSMASSRGSRVSHSEQNWESGGLPEPHAEQRIWSLTGRIACPGHSRTNHAGGCVRPMEQASWACPVGARRSLRLCEASGQAYLRCDSYLLMFRTEGCSCESPMSTTAPMALRSLARALLGPAAESFQPQTELGQARWLGRATLIGARSNSVGRGPDLAAGVAAG